MAETNSALDQLKEMLSDPKQMEKLGPILDMLTNGKTGGSPTQSRPTPNVPDDIPASGDDSIGEEITPSSPPASQPRMRGSAGNTPGGGLNMDTVMKIKNIYDSVNAQDDRRINLLEAVKPYLRDSRISKLDTAVKILRVTKIGAAMKNMDQF